MKAFLRSWTLSSLGEGRAGQPLNLGVGQDKRSGRVASEAMERMFRFPRMGGSEPGSVESSVAWPDLRVGKLSLGYFICVVAPGDSEGTRYPCFAGEDSEGQGWLGVILIYGVK